MEQRSADWYAARLGRVTASRVSDVIAKTAKGWGATRRNYAAQLICERLTGVSPPSFTNAAMQHGIDTEPQARAAYSLHMGVDVAEIGFVHHPDLEMAGCSPDGLIGLDGLTEIKCPNTATHLDTLEVGKFPADYYPQIQFQLSCTGREWCDAVSFDPRLPEAMRLFVERIPRDEPYIRELNAMVRDFLAELDERVAKLRALYEPAREAA